MLLVPYLLKLLLKLNRSFFLAIEDKIEPNGCNAISLKSTCIDDIVHVQINLLLTFTTGHGFEASSKLSYKSSAF